MSDRIINAGIRPTAHRMAVAQFVFNSKAHPSANDVYVEVSRSFPTISRATVYNTLKVFTEHGLLRRLKLRDDRVIYDPNVERHHHFVDTDTGEIHDVAWEAIEVRRVNELTDLEVHDYEVVLHGRHQANERDAP